MFAQQTLEFTDAGDVVAALGELVTIEHELELVEAWADARNRAALQVVAVHIPGPVGKKAKRLLQRLAALAGTTPPSEPPASR